MHSAFLPEVFLGSSVVVSWREEADEGVMEYWSIGAWEWWGVHDSKSFASGVLNFDAQVGSMGCFG